MPEIKSNRHAEDDPLILKIHRLARSLTRASMAEYIKEFGLGVPQTQILNAIGVQGHLTSMVIAKHTDMNKGLVSRTLKQLTDENYVFSIDDDQDARKRIWRLTAKGEAFIEKFRPVGMRRREELLKYLEKGEREQISKLLDKLYRASEELRLSEARARKGSASDDGFEDEDEG